MFCDNLKMHIHRRSSADCVEVTVLDLEEPQQWHMQQLYTGCAELIALVSSEATVSLKYWKAYASVC